LRTDAERTHVTPVFDDVLELAHVRERIEADGAEPVGGTPEAFGAHIAKEHAKWSKVVKFSGAKVD
jgi:tripartite-type tricarboxylate transporter receptor subunit TctC